MNKVAQELRSRINPAYAAQLGTESYERRVSAEEIERLEAEVESLTTQISDCRDAVPAGLAGDELAWAVASTEGVAEYVKSAFKQLEIEAVAATLRIENGALEIANLRQDNTDWMLHSVEQAKQRDALALDAARYRWLRSKTKGTRGSCFDQQWFLEPNVKPISGANIMQGSVAQHFDDAIDAAMKEGVQ